MGGSVACHSTRREPKGLDTVPAMRGDDRPILVRTVEISISQTQTDFSATVLAVI
jgi:hypothetical protein